MIEIGTKTAEAGEPEGNSLSQLLQESKAGDQDALCTFLEEAKKIIDREYHTYARYNPWLKAEYEQGDFSNAVLINIRNRYPGIIASNGSGSVKKYITRSSHNHFITLLRNRAMSRARGAINAERVGKRSSSIELRTAIRNAVNQLSPTERRLVNAKYECPGATLKEIADDIGVAHGTARNLYRRALRKLEPILRHRDWTKEAEFSVEPEDMDDGSG
jgi:RNA polymerase sigma factor (sigma-70 family)